MIDPEAFREFEHDGWQRAAEHYVDAFGAVTARAAGPLLDAVAAGSATELLDVATGPGFVAAEAASRGARVIGVDFSPAMIAAAGRRYHDILFRAGGVCRHQRPDARPDLDPVVAGRRIRGDLARRRTNGGDLAAPDAGRAGGDSRGGWRRGGTVPDGRSHRAADAGHTGGRSQAVNQQFGIWNSEFGIRAPISSSLVAIRHSQFERAFRIPNSQF